MSESGSAVKKWGKTKDKWKGNGKSLEMNG
jgi:hypothetical protein